MKSKNVNRLIAVGVGVLILIIFSGIIYFSLGKPKFQIYKEVCEEGFFNHNFYNDCIFLLMDYEDLMNMSMHNDFSRMCNLWAIKIGEIKSSCEKFEVDSITFPFECEEDNIRKCGISIPRNDLDTYFLEKNCEAIDFSRCEDLSCKNQKVYEYKCGNYFVELK